VVNLRVIVSGLNWNGTTSGGKAMMFESTNAPRRSFG
jgi:hypothetical protein